MPNKNKMTHNDIHDIITQISQNLTCPKCKAKILPNNIKITDAIEKEFLFDVNCSRCQAEMSLSAHVEKKQNPKKTTCNHSTQITHDHDTDEPITAYDVRAIQNELRNFCGSFIETFS